MCRSQDPAKRELSASPVRLVNQGCPKEIADRVEVDVDLVGKRVSGPPIDVNK